MLRTLIRHLIDTVNNPYGMFRSAGDVVPMRNPYGEPIFFAGQKSVVFKVTIDGNLSALKCYTSPTALAEVYHYMTLHPDPIVCPTRFLPQELFVGSSPEGYYVDVVVMPWLAGRTLDYAINKAAHELDKEQFASLAESFDSLAAALLKKEWAHGDLKPQNIITMPDGSLSLIDFDSIYALSLPPRGALGTLNYTHPLRTVDDYSKEVDDYSLALISVALHALAVEPDLYDRYSSIDNLLIRPDLAIDGADQCIDHIHSLFAGEQSLDSLCLALASRKIAVDNIDQIFNILNKCTLHQSLAEEKHSLFC